MSAPLQPLSDYVVAETEEAEKKTASGLYIPDNAQEKPKTLVVVAVGPDVTQIKIGDRIVTKAYESTDVKVNGKEYVLVQEKAVLAKVK